MDWTTPNEVIYEDNAIYLRQFRASNDHTDTVVLPPQAGHGGEVADWPVDGRSLVQCLLANTNGGVFVVDFKSCTLERKNETYEDLVGQVDTAIHQAIEGATDKVNIIGLCQGGTLATIYTALYPEMVANLVPVGCPIDTRAADSALSQAMSMPLFAYQMIVAMQGGMISGDWMLMNWKGMNFVDHYVTRYTEPSAKKELFYSWYDETRNIPGGWYIELMEQLFLKNLLIKNEFMVGDRTVDLSQITCSVSMVAGEKDDISPREHVFSLKQHVPHAQEYIVKNAGHIGCFISAEANSVVMPAICKEF